MSLAGSRQRALRAALAVTLGGIAACGEEAAGAVDSGGDDTSADGASSDVQPSDTDDRDTRGDAADDVSDLDGSGLSDVPVPTDVNPADADVEPDSVDDVAAEVGDTNGDTDLDVVPDTAADTETSDVLVDADVSADADVDDNTPCKGETSDNVCPSYCNETTDWDCCDTYCGGPGWGSLDTMSMMCFCAVEGPFAPPSFDRPRARARLAR